MSKQRIDKYHDDDDKDEEEWDDEKEEEEEDEAIISACAASDDARELIGRAADILPAATRIVRRHEANGEPKLSLSAETLPVLKLSLPGESLPFPLGSRAVYTGESKQGEPHGHGLMQFLFGNSTSCVYTGEFRNGQIHGLGCLAFTTGAVNYTGQWENGKIRCGTLLYVDGSIYLGQFGDGNVRHGYGVERSPVDRECYKGAWCDGFKHGRGMQRFANGDVYRGDFRFDKFHGRGIFKCSSSGDVYDGQFENDQMIRGVLTKSDGTVGDYVGDGDGTVLVEMREPRKRGQETAAAADAKRKKQQLIDEEKKKQQQRQQQIQQLFDNENKKRTQLEVEEQDGRARCVRRRREADQQLRRDLQQRWQRFPDTEQTARAALKTEEEDARRRVIELLHAIETERWGREQELRRLKQQLQYLRQSAEPAARSEIKKEHQANWQRISDFRAEAQEQHRKQQQRIAQELLLRQQFELEQQLQVRISRERSVRAQIVQDEIRSRQQLSSVKKQERELAEAQRLVSLAKQERLREAEQQQNRATATAAAAAAAASPPRASLPPQQQSSSSSKISPYLCVLCQEELSRNAFSSNQLSSKAPGQRRCKKCILAALEHSSSPNSNSSAPAAAAAAAAAASSAVLPAAAVDNKTMHEQNLKQEKLQQQPPSQPTAPPKKQKQQQQQRLVVKVPTPTFNADPPLPDVFLCPICIEPAADNSGRSCMSYACLHKVCSGCVEKMRGGGCCPMCRKRSAAAVDHTFTAAVQAAVEKKTCTHQFSSDDCTPFFSR